MAAWEYPSPADLSPESLDWDTWLGTAPKKSFDPYLFARWRCWKEYGTGVAGDLLVHLISGMQFVLGINEAPKRASAFGGIYRWKDGRNTPDVHPVLFAQPGTVLVFVFGPAAAASSHCFQIPGFSPRNSFTPASLQFLAHRAGSVCPGAR